MSKPNMEGEMTELTAIEVVAGDDGVEYLVNVVREDGYTVGCGAIYLDEGDDLAAVARDEAAEHVGDAAYNLPVRMDGCTI